MSARFDELEATMPKPTLPRWYVAYPGPIGTLFNSMLYFDAAMSDYERKRDAIAAYLRLRTGGDTLTN